MIRAMSAGRFRLSRTAALCGLLLFPLLAGVCAGAENVHQGPLRLPGQSFFQGFRLSLVPWCEAPLAKGEFELGTFATWVNIWGWKPRQYLVDGETLRVRGVLGYGLSPRVHVRLEVPVTLRTGGFMDSFVEGFHGTLGLFNAYKEEFPRNRFRMVFYSPEGGEQRLDSRDTGLYLDDLVLSVKWHPFAGNRYLPAVVLGADLKIPTGFLEGSGLDAGGSVLLAKRVWRLYGYLGAQFTYCGRGDVLGVRMVHEQWSFLAGLEVRLSERFSLVLQEITNTGVARDLYEFSEATYEMALGFKARVGPETFLEFGLVENFVHYDNSPDFGLHFGVAHRFGA